MPDFDFADDLDALQACQDAGIEVPILKPGTQDVMLTIRVCGPDSAQAGRARERQQEEMLARGALTPLTREEQLDQDCRLLARLCMSWDARAKDGQPIGFTEDAAFDLLRRYPVVRASVDQAAASRARFMPRSSNAFAAPSATA